MKINNFISVLLIITMCFILCMISGCNGAGENNSSVDNDSSYVEIVESASGSGESNVVDSTSSDSYSSDVTIDASSNVSSVVSTPDVESKPESQPITSTPDETPSQDAPTDKPATESKPTDALVETPTYPTIKVGVVTTYYGYRGCFVLGSSDDYPVSSILGVDDDLLTATTTEYYDVTTNTCLNFVFEGGILEVKDLMYNHVYIVGKGSTPVQVVY